MGFPKVYWKTLSVLLRGLKAFIQRNQFGLQQNLTTPQYECVIAVLDAVVTCLEALPENTPVV